MVSSEVVLQRLVTEASIRHRNEFRLFSLISATGNRVVVNFAGVKEEFLFRNNENPYRTPNLACLEPQDTCVLLVMAQCARKASEAGYNPDIIQNLNKAVKSKLVINRHWSRSLEDVNSARNTLLYQVCLNWLSGDDRFEVIRVTDRQVEMRYGSFYHEVVWDKSKLSAYLKPSSGWLSIEWFSFMRMFGEQLLEAVAKGYLDVQAIKSRDPSLQKRLI